MVFAFALGRAVFSKVVHLVSFRIEFFIKALGMNEQVLCRVKKSRATQLLKKRRLKKRASINMIRKFIDLIDRDLIGINTRYARLIPCVKGDSGFRMENFGACYLLYLCSWIRDDLNPLENLKGKTKLKIIF